MPSIPVNKRLGKPLYIQISDTLRQQIIEGFLVPGSRLASSRNYAIEFGVSRTSVVAAFEQLQAEGYIKSHRGSGTYVTPIGSLDVIEQTHDVPESKTGHFQWPSVKTAPQSGAADMRLFPYRRWARCIARVARESPESMLQHIDPFGDRQLRESIARYLFEWRGMKVSPAQILMTAGSIDALEICIRTLLKENDRIGLEDPGYLSLRNFVNDMGLSPVWLPVSGSGAKVPLSNSARKTPKLVVLTPSHQFPLGGAMSPGRRVEFLNWAEKNGSWIIEDDYDSEFRYAGKPIPALTGFDHAGRSIYIGSFAKIYSTGLRLGFLVAPPSLVDEFRLTLTRYASKASLSMQRALSEFMDSGEFYRHLRRVRRIYGERRRILATGLRKEMGGILSFDDHQAGMLLAAKLPEGYNDVAIAKTCQAESIQISALSTYYADKKKLRGLIISFCMNDKEEIMENISKINKILQRFNPEKGGG